MDNKFLGRGKVLASTTALVFGLGLGYNASAQSQQQNQSGSSTTHYNTYQSTPNTMNNWSPDIKSGSMNQMGTRSNTSGSLNQNNNTQNQVNSDSTTYEVYQGHEMTGNCGAPESQTSGINNSQSSFNYQSNLNNQGNLNNQNNLNNQEEAFANPDMYQNMSRFNDSAYDPFDSAYDDFDDVYENDDPNVMYDYDNDGIAEFGYENYGDLNETRANDYDGNGVADYATVNYAGYDQDFTYEHDTLDQNIAFDVDLNNDSDVIGVQDDMLGTTTPGVSHGSGIQSVAYGPYITPLALSDAEILDIFVTMNNGEIMTSRPAIDETAKDWVRDYAQKMIDMHTDVVKRAQDLNVEPAQNLISSALETNAQGVSTKLTALDGRELDNQYITTQLAMHQNALDMLDNTLIPLAQSQELKNLLTEARAHVANHLAEVQKLYHKLD